MLRYFWIKLFPNITTLFIGNTYMFHCMSWIEGGGEDTMAWASWPPPQIYIFEIMRNSINKIMSNKNSDIFSLIDS